MAFPINKNLISHPMNWVVIFFMLLLTGLIGHETLKLLGLISPTSGLNSSYGAVSPGLKPGSVTGAIQPQSAGNVIPGE